MSARQTSEWWRGHWKLHWESLSCDLSRDKSCESLDTHRRLRYDEVREQCKHVGHVLVDVQFHVHTIGSSVLDKLQRLLVQNVKLSGLNKEWRQST